MAVAVMLRLLAFALAPVSGAWALGAAAPFTPPLPPAAAASAGLSGAVGPNAGALPPGGAMPGLTGIRLGSRPQALIDGQWFAPGAQVRGARLLAIQADAVLLQPPDGTTQRLALTPQVELRRVSTPPQATAAARAVRPPQARSP